MKTRVLSLCVVAPLSACVTVGYQTVVLDAQFENGATRIAAVAPVNRYRDDFFNVALGPYQVDALAVGDTEVLYSGREAGQVERKATVDNTGWNLILNQAFIGEWVTYRQYRTEDEYTLSFALDTPSGQRVNTRCVVNNTGLENEEASRLEVSSLAEDAPRNRAVAYGEWLATRVICTLRQGDQTWFLRTVQQTDQPPKVDLVGDDEVFSVRVLDKARVKQPYTAALQADEPVFEATGKALPGIQIDGRSGTAAAVSLGNGNTAIWLAASREPADEALLVAASYVWILRAWRGESF
ncbi:MAG: hypothetical protein AAF460_05995 [Pseudomonadota bacterium]